ncbi:MAG: hypothetical protein IT565_11065 [Rhodospirillales bacterium]|nr:hypothetical protein [Rhodospirillales bacterium]
MRVAWIVPPLLALLAPQGARAADCPNRPPPAVEVNVRTDPGRPDYRNTVRIADLTRMFLKQHRASFTGQQVTTGLTVSDAEFAIATQLVTLKVADGRTCAWLSGVDMTLRYKAVTVYVASEYKPGSCEHKTVLEHENEHVAIDRRNLADYAPRVKAALAAKARGLGPAVGRTDKAAGNYLLDQLKRTAQEVIDAMNQARERDHGRLDSPASYRATQARCKGW